MSRNSIEEERKRMIPLVWLDRFSDEEEYMDEHLEYQREEYENENEKEEEDGK